MPALTPQQAIELAIQHHAAGRLADAEGICEQILGQIPEHADALHILAVMAHQLRNSDDAVAFARRAIASDPSNPDFRNTLGLALASSNRFDDSIAAFREALRLNPESTEARFNLAMTLNNLGASLARAGQRAGAIDAYRQATTLQPDLFAAHLNLAGALRDQGRPDLAVEAYRWALRLKCDHAEAHFCLAQCLHQLGEVDLAIEGYTAALHFDPNLAAAHNGLGNAFSARGQIDEALNSFRRAVEIDPGYVAAHSNLVYLMHFDPASDMHAIRREQDRWSARHAEPLRPRIRPRDIDRRPDRKLRIGYVSPSFFRQAECHFVLPLIEAHDRERYEVHLYASVERADEVTERFQRSADAWHDVLKLSDEQLAEKIRGDRIDILIDLTMHMSGDRLRTFAVKPAPIQISWLAYPGATGLPTMDYRLTDNFLDPPASDTSWSVEKPLRLPDCWCCYDPVTPLPDIGPLPALSNGFITFGSVNNFTKINKLVLESWSRILQPVANSRLLLLCPPGHARDTVRATMQSRGVDPARIEFVYHLPRFDYLNLYNRIDLALDPFPYNGITTTCDAMHMGVPVVTTPDFKHAGGQRPPGPLASRAGKSILTAAGLTEFIPQSADEQLALISRLSVDLQVLSQLRLSLRRRVQRSPLCDANRFARSFESALRSVWATSRS